jgi:hypothetical protein
MRLTRGGMRRAVEIPSAIWKQTKRAAKKADLHLGEFVTAALVSYLDEGPEACDVGRIVREATESEEVRTSAMHLPRSVESDSQTDLSAPRGGAAGSGVTHPDQTRPAMPSEQQDVSADQLRALLKRRGLPVEDPVKDQDEELF